MLGNHSIPLKNQTVKFIDAINLGYVDWMSPISKEEDIKVQKAIRGLKEGKEIPKDVLRIIQEIQNSLKGNSPPSLLRSNDTSSSISRRELRPRTLLILHQRKTMTFKIEELGSTQRFSEWQVSTIPS